MPKYLNLIFILSLVYVFLQILFFDNMPEYFPYTHELGILFYKISLSIIPSYIFYFIVVHLKQERDKFNINIFVEKEVNSIIRNHQVEINLKEQKTALNYYNNEITIEIASIIKNIFLVMPFLDTELVKILSEILNSKYSKSVTMVYSENIISISPKDFDEYKNFHTELKEYYDLKLVQYSKLFPRKI